jgi:DNA-binding response OmpR family regulator
VISLLGIDDAGQKIKGFEADGVDCITKPFHADEVLGRWRCT